MNIAILKTGIRNPFDPMGSRFWTYSVDKRMCKLIAYYDVWWLDLGHGNGPGPISREEARIFLKLFMG